MSRTKNQGTARSDLFSRTAGLDRALLGLARNEPEIYKSLRQIGKAAAKWKTLPKGWTQKSVEKFWKTLTGEAKHKVTKCIKEMGGKVDDPGAFCASLCDKIEGSEWRSRKTAVSPEITRTVKELRAAGTKTAGQVAKTIAEQMGGVRRLRAMLGAQVTALSGDKGLGIKWPNKQRSKGNYVEIIYDRGQDLYDMTFYNLTMQAKKSVKSFKGVYADLLGELFEKQTGWYLRLAHRVAVRHMRKKAGWVIQNLKSGNKVTDRQVYMLVNREYTGVHKGSLKWDAKTQFNKYDNSVIKGFSLEGLDPHPEYGGEFTITGQIAAGISSQGIPFCRLELQT